MDTDGTWGSFTEQFSTGARLQSLKQRQNMLRALPHQCRQHRRAAPSHQMWAATPPPLQPQRPLDTEANCTPHRLKVPKSVPRQRERDPHLPQKPRPSQPAQGPCPHRPCTSGPALPARQACRQLRPLRGQPFSQLPLSTAQREGTRSQAGPPGRRGSGLSRARRSARGGSVFHRTRVTVQTHHQAGHRPQPCPCVAENRLRVGEGIQPPAQASQPETITRPPGPCPQPSMRGGPSSQPTRQMEAARQKGSPFPACMARADTGPPLTSRWALPETSAGRPEVKTPPPRRGYGGWRGRGQEAGSRSTGSPRPAGLQACRGPGARCSSRKSSTLRADSKGPGAPPHCELTSHLSASPTVCRKDLESPAHTGLSAPQGQPGPAPLQRAGRRLVCEPWRESWSFRK